MINSKLVTIESHGKIPVLGGLIGPVTTPSRLKIDVIIALINSGKAVYEVNPANVKEKIRLTRLNVRTENYPNNVNHKISQSRMNNSALQNHGATNNNHITSDTNTGLTKVTIEPSVIKTTIDQKTNDVTKTDVFVSNKKS